MPDKLWGRGKGFVGTALILGAALELVAIFACRHFDLFDGGRDLLDGLTLFGLLALLLAASSQLLSSLFGSDLDEGASAVLIAALWAWLASLLAVAGAVLLAITAVAFQLVIPFWVVGKLLQRRG
jgi:mannose/fructose/N-acetylgalactosamine-specific phosphotransferase system component IIC